VAPSLNVVVLVSETGKPVFRTSRMAALERGEELAVDTARRASAFTELVILPASLRGGFSNSGKKNKKMMILDRIGIRFRIWQIIFAPFLGNDRENGPFLFAERENRRQEPPPPSTPSEPVP
jgi:hypothetical protein